MPGRALLLGGMTRDYHQFLVNGPALAEILGHNGFDVAMSEDLEVLAAPGLAASYTLIANLTTGRTLSAAQGAGLLGWLRGGGGLLGLHNAADTFLDCPEYVAALGGRFLRHPPQLDIPVTFTDTAHPVVAGLPTFTVHDELYLLDWDPGRVHLLAETHATGPAVPVMWVRQERDGRVAYLSLGHNRAVYDHAVIRELVGRAARWCIRAL